MRIVSRIPLVIGMAIIVLSTIKCEKESTEDDLNMSIDASLVEITPSPVFDFNLAVLSAMPPSGVTIEFAVKGEFDNRLYYNSRSFTKSPNTRLTIYNLPRQVMCICTITVTSRTKGNNVATTSFRIGYK
jgi:hypothetical protein